MTAILDEEIPAAGAVTELHQYGNQAQVRIGGDTAFATEFDDGWKVVAAACTPPGERPYDCKVEGSSAGARDVHRLPGGRGPGPRLRAHAGDLAPMTGVRRFVREASLSLGFGALFLAALVGQVFAEFTE